MLYKPLRELNLRNNLTHLPLYLVAVNILLYLIYAAKKKKNGNKPFETEYLAVQIMHFQRRASDNLLFLFLQRQQFSPPTLTRSESSFPTSLDLIQSGFSPIVYLHWPPRNQCGNKSGRSSL